MPWVFNKVFAFWKLFTLQFLWNWSFPFLCCSSFGLLGFHLFQQRLIFKALREFLCRLLQPFLCMAHFSVALCSTISGHHRFLSHPVAQFIQSMRLYWVPYPHTTICTLSLEWNMGSLKSTWFIFLSLNNHRPVLPFVQYLKWLYIVIYFI